MAYCRAMSVLLASRTSVGVAELRHILGSNDVSTALLHKCGWFKEVKSTYCIFNVTKAEHTEQLRTPTLGVVSANVAT